MVWHLLGMLGTGLGQFTAPLLVPFGNSHASARCSPRGAHARSKIHQASLAAQLTADATAKLLAAHGAR